MLPGWLASMTTTLEADWVLVQIQTREDSRSWCCSSFCCSCNADSQAAGFNRGGVPVRPYLQLLVQLLQAALGARLLLGTLGTGQVVVEHAGSHQQAPVSGLSSRQVHAGGAPQLGR